MEHYIAKLNEYLSDYKNELKNQFIGSRVALKRGEITSKQFESSRVEIHDYVRITDEILLFFREDSRDIFGYFYELSCHLVEPLFTSKEAYLILRYTINTNYRNSKDAIQDILSLESVASFDFKSMSRSSIDRLIATNRINVLLDGNIEDATPAELAFIKEFYENFDKFKMPVDDIKKKIVNAYDAMDKFETHSDIDRMVEAFRNLRVKEECIAYVKNYLEYRVDKRAQKKKNNSERTLTTPFIYKTNVRNDILTESDVRSLKKDIRNIFDMYHRTIVKMPSYEELIHTLKCLKRLDELDAMGISLFIKQVVSYYMEKDLPLVSNYDEMIYLASIMFYYKTDEKSIYDFIRYSSEKNIQVYENFFYEYEAKKDKIKYYDLDTASILEEFLEELITSDVETKNVVAISIMDELEKINSDKSYSYELEQAKMSKRGC